MQEPYLQLKTFLKGEGFQVIDIGPYDPDISVDYVDYANQLSTIISNKEASCMAVCRSYKPYQVLNIPVVKVSIAK